jgi:hypothetical protein
MKAMYRLMQPCIGTSNRGLMIRPTKPWGGDKGIEFIASGHSGTYFGKI